MTHSQTFWSKVAQHINVCEGEDQVIHDIHGGDTSTAFCLDCGNRKYFVKTQKEEFLPIFQAELMALSAMQEFCPKPLCSGIAENAAFLIMEYCPMSARGHESALGSAIARLHDIEEQRQRYGWPQDNFIGLTTQKNDWNHDWADFFWRNRIAPQLQLSYDKGYFEQLAKLEKALQRSTQRILASHRPKPALLHGDLWSGNKGYLTNGNPIIFDPAAYYGDPETDIAMAELFGGFHRRFYESYYVAHPPLRGHKKRKRLYQLYHILNHLNLFGDAYLVKSLESIHTIIND